MNFGALAGVAGLAIVAYLGISKVMSSDGLASYRVRSAELLRDGVTIKGAEIRNYKGERLVVSADVAETIVLDDWSLVQWEGIENGTFVSEEGQEIYFETDRATYGTFSKAVIVEAPVRVWSDDFDLKADGFTYDHGTETILVRGDVRGTLNDGALKAQQVVIHVGDKRLKAGQTEWNGEVALQETQKRSNWAIVAGDLDYIDGIMVVTAAKGQDADMIVKCDKMTYDRTKDLVTADGNVRYWGVDANLTCDRAVIDRKTGKADLTGSKPVTMLVKAEADKGIKQEEIPPLTPLVPAEIQKGRPTAPTNSSQADQLRDTENLRQYPIALEAQKIEYWYKEGQRRAVINGNPWAHQQLPDLAWRKVWADRAEYDGEEEILDLFSANGKKSVRMENSIGDNFLALTMKVFTKEGVDRYSGKEIEGVYVPQDDETLPNPPGRGGGGTTGGNGGLSGPIRGI